jgi:predicted nuclease of predicted toxin-antitoxin system
VTAKLLLDENISPRVARDLCADGVDAAAVGDQFATIRRALLAIEQRGDMVNTLLRIAEDGSMQFELIPSND